MHRILLPSLVLLAACAGTADDSGVVGGDPARQACDARGEAGTAVDASLDAVSAPRIEVGQPHTLALPTGSVSYVRVIPDEPGPHLLFVGTADVASEHWFEGAELDLPVGSPNEFCEDTIPAHFDLDLEAGQHTLGFGPAAVPQVWVMLSSAAGHGFDE